jgi:hypothetical protein
MASQLYGVSGFDPLALAGATLGAWPVRCLAGFIPPAAPLPLNPCRRLRSE